MQLPTEPIRNSNDTGGKNNSNNDFDEGWEEITSGKAESSWFADADFLSSLRFQKLEKDISVNVVIVGGGIAGMTTAYMLSKVGKKVAVVDDGNIGSGETGRTTAHITHALDDRYYEIEKMHGKRGARLAAESHTAAIDTIESIVREENIDCGFKRLDGYLFLDPTDDESKKSLAKELAATHRAGIVATEIVERAPLKSFDTGPCLRFPNQAQFQPLKYLAGLALAILRNGGVVFTETHVQEVTGVGVKTADGHKIIAKKIVVATNGLIIDKISKIYDKQIPMRTYVIAARFKKGAIPEALYWDTGNMKSKNMVPPYHYVRIQELGDDSDYDLLVVGGEDHPTGAASDMEKRYQALEQWAKNRFPIEDVVYRWSGQVLEPKDSMAFIGRNPMDKRKNIFIATGDSGNGMTHGTIAGMLLSDLIQGKKKKNRWTRLYNPSRKIKSRRNKEDSSSSPSRESSSKSKKFGMNEAMKKAETLKPGEGIVIEIRKQDPMAFYRDVNDSRLHSFSALCTHLGCTINWNDSEKSFDCPCHGSRFSYSGQVINGPANDNLEPSKQS